MGSGKTTLGRLAAAQLDWAFLDLDVEIERRCARPVSAIFSDFGEAYFRRQETESLTEALKRSYTVIALGGGVPETPGNRDMLQQSSGTATVFLTAPFQTLYDRCVAQARVSPNVRPVLAYRPNAEARFLARQPLYRSIATHTLDTTALSEGQSLDALWAALAVR
jgi:shikimate kinase